MNKRRTVYEPDFRVRAINRSTGEIVEGPWVKVMNDYVIRQMGDGNQHEWRIEHCNE